MTLTQVRARSRCDEKTVSVRHSRVWNARSWCWDRQEPRAGWSAIRHHSRHWHCYVERPLRSGIDTPRPICKEIPTFRGVLIRNVKLVFTTTYWIQRISVQAAVVTIKCCKRCRTLDVINALDGLCWVWRKKSQKWPRSWLLGKVSLFWQTGREYLHFKTAP